MMTDSNMNQIATSTQCDTTECSRRSFLAISGVATTMLLSDLFPGRVHALDESTSVQVTSLPRKKIGMVSELAPRTAVPIQYPSDDPLHNGMLIRTGERSGGGVGSDQDIVAFSARCTHQGGSLDGAYRAEHSVLGPCPLHLTTFDLTRHGMVVAGHATQALPQIILEVDGDDIYAVGIAGLLYGHNTNG